MTTTATAPHQRGPACAQPLRRHLLGRQPTSVVWGWAGPLLVTAIGGFLRFWQLGRPHQLVFDETYYVKQGTSMLDFGYERSVDPKFGTTPDEAFTHGTASVYGGAADFVVHPPVGKWVIAVGEHVFGATSSFGWRFSVALCGTLSILMLARGARRLFGSTLLGCTAGLLLAFDGQHFVHSRTGLLDLIVMFWALAGFCALLIDRDHSRERLAVAMSRARAAGPGDRLDVVRRCGPWLLWRPWRVVAGVCLGLSTGTKWSGLFYLAAFGLMSVLWDVGARRAAGVRRFISGTATRDVPLAFVSIAVVGAATYLAGWTGWFRSSGVHAGWDRNWGEQHPSKHFGFMGDALRGLGHYHREMWDFNTNLTSDHPYKTNPWSWLIQGRPTSFYYETKQRGQEGCVVSQCSKAITSIGTPTLWWGAAIAIFVLLAMWALRRDWRAGAVLAGLAGGYLPWFQFQERTIYSFYTVAFAPWAVLAVVYVLGLVLGEPTASPRRRLIGATCAGSYVVACVALFAFYYPLYTAQVIPYSEWMQRMWFPSWV